MARVESKVQDDFHVSYHVGQHGWEHVNIFICFQTFQFAVTEVYGTGGVDALLELCEALLRNEAIKTPLFDEPGGVVLQLEPLPKQKHLACFRAFDIGGRIGEYYNADLHSPLFDIVIKRKQLFTNLIMELWIEMLHSQERSYRKNRSVFPVEKLVMLNMKWNASDLGPSCLFHADS